VGHLDAKGKQMIHAKYDSRTCVKHPDNCANHLLYCANHPKSTW